jgi:transcriptional regulator with XRE-family HTH domain
MLVLTTLRQRRNELGRSIRDVAAEAQMDYAALSKIERGLQQPRLDTLRRIVRALDLTEAEYWLAVIQEPPGDGNGRTKP